MKRHFFLFLSILSLSGASEGFIDDVEYGKGLYENPRGISCQECHGDRGEGRLIAKYKSKGKEKKLIAPQINHLSLEEFEKNINESKGVMPKYFLTNKEIKAIYEFLQSQALDVSDKNGFR